MDVNQLIALLASAGSDPDGIDQLSITRGSAHSLLTS
jgi:hypothetical protein